MERFSRLQTEALEARQVRPRRKGESSRRQALDEDDDNYWSDDPFADGPDEAIARPPRVTRLLAQKAPVSRPAIISSVRLPPPRERTHRLSDITNPSPGPVKISKPQPTASSPLAFHYVNRNRDRVKRLKSLRVDTSDPETSGFGNGERESDGDFEEEEE